MKIVMLSNDGTVVETIEDDEIGDLSKPMAQQDLIIKIKECQERIKEEFDE